MLIISTKMRLDILIGVMLIKNNHTSRNKKQIEPF